MNPKKPEKNRLFTIALIALVLLCGAALIISISGSKAPSGNTSADDGKTPFGTPVIPRQSPGSTALATFQSGDDLLDAFKNSSTMNYVDYEGVLTRSWGMPVPMLSATPATAGSISGRTKSTEYSTTNVQVAGVDEADIVKTDGSNIYLISKNRIIIAKAYPAGDARILSNLSFSNFTPQEFFIKGDRLLVFGNGYDASYEPWVRVNGESSRPRPWCRSSYASARLYDVSDPATPRLLKTVDIEGSYMTARMIGDHAYFVINTYPCVTVKDGLAANDIIPLYRTDGGAPRTVALPTEIRYIPPKECSSFVTICSLSMKGSGGNLVKETIAGSSQELYASQENLYFTKGTNQYYYRDGSSGNETTTVVKFRLSNGQITAGGSGKVPGHLLNQFSMDESNGYFRIATTRGSLWDTKNPSTSNIYVLDSGMKTVGALEGLAPGEKIYSTRFMDSRCYMVTFKKVDPLFVIDLSDQRNPKVLGKLKIPGYSDYLHPYDENHVIGIGKDAIDAGESETSARNLDFAWYQGVKMALFDVTDVEHPKELYKVVIGDRGTDSPVLTDHRAFLFDKNKGLLVLPVSVAEIQGEKTSDNQYGDYVFQGAYVYDLSLSKGFVLRGKISHNDSDDVYKKSGMYIDSTNAISRSLYIDNVLYTLSSNRLQLNDLTTLGKLKAIEL